MKQITLKTDKYGAASEPAVQGVTLKQIKLRYRNHVPCSNTSVIKFWTTYEKCVRVRECFQSQTFISSFKIRYKQREHVFDFFFFFGGGGGIK